MAQFNSANGSFQGHNRTLFEVNQIATSNGAPVTTANRFPVDIGNTTNTTYARNDDNTQLDTSGRLRVATQGQQWWYSPSIDKDGDLRYQESFTGTGAASVWVQNLAAIHLTSGTANNGFTIRASRRRHKIRPGVSHQWYTTACFDGKQTNVTKRLGMFTSYNGIFFEVSDDLYAVVRRRLPDGTLKELRVRRDAFSHDRLDGSANYNPTGFNWTVDTTAALTSWVSTTPVTVSATTVYRTVFNHDGTAHTKFVVGDKVEVSGITPTTYNNTPYITALDASTVTVTYIINPGSFSSMSSGSIKGNGFLRATTFFFDFHGGRTSHIRFCIQGPLGPETLHVFDLGNTLGTQYENAPALMERAEIQNTGAVDHLPSLTIMQSAYNIEAESELNPGFGVATNNTYLQYSTAGTAEYPVIGVALRAGEPYQRGDLQVQSIHIVDLNNFGNQNSQPATFYWRLVLNPTIGGTVPASVDVGKATRQWNYTAATTISGGIDLTGGYCTSYSGAIDVKSALNFINLGSNIDYTDSDKIVLVVKQVRGGSSNGQIIATINFIESL